MPDERSKHLAGIRSNVFWIVLLLISGLIVLDTGVLQILAIWGVITVLIGAGAVIYRITLFGRKTDDLLSKGRSISEYDYRKQTRKLMYVIGLTVLAFLLPLFLSGFLNAVLWFTLIIGAIDGWLVHLVAYNVYILNWESRHGGKIFAIQIWNGQRVTHSGLAFERKGIRK